MWEVTIIVFSKDRPFQLNECIRSMLLYLNEEGIYVYDACMYVLYVYMLVFMHAGMYV